MNADMQRHTARRLMRLCVVLAVFALLGSLLGASLRYRKMLASAVAEHQTIAKNLGKVRRATKETEQTVAALRRLLPPGYGKRSADWLVFSRLDALKEQLKPAAWTVKPIEHKEGFARAEFSAELPLSRGTGYRDAINLLGSQETLAFPFVKVSRISVGSSGGAGLEGKLHIEGSVLTPEPEVAAP